MTFSVPLLLNVSAAVIHRLSPASTRDVRAHTGSTSGYDDDFKEVIAYDDSQLNRTVVRDSARIELPAVRIPCQVEPVSVDRLKQFPAGEGPDSDIRLVLHRKDLERLKLIDRYQKPLIKTNDRVSRIELKKRPGIPTVILPDPGLYIWEVQPGSFGFGGKGYDIYIVFLAERERARL